MPELFVVAIPVTIGSCLLCATFSSLHTVEVKCTNKNTPRNRIEGRQVYERTTEPGYCLGTGLDVRALQVLPKCLQPPFQQSCKTAAMSTA